MVIRNDAGLIMASLTQQIPLPTSVIEVEALAARRALEFAPYKEPDEWRQQADPLRKHCS